MSNGMNIFQSTDISFIHQALFRFCRSKLNLEPSEDIFNEFKELMKDYDGELSKREFGYNTQNITSLKEVINENTISKFRIFIEPKHDGTQIVLKYDGKVYVWHEDIDKYKVLNWPKNKEGIMVKIYDEKFELDYKEARNFNMMAFKYKPLIRLIEEELKNRKIKIDHRLLAIVISELITEYAKNKELSFYEMLDNVKKDHIELKNFIEINVDLIKILWNESLIVKSIL